MSHLHLRIMEAYLTVTLDNNGGTFTLENNSGIRQVYTRVKKLDIGTFYSTVKKLYIGLFTLESKDQHKFDLNWSKERLVRGQVYSRDNRKFIRQPDLH